MNMDFGNDLDALTIHNYIERYISKNIDNCINVFPLLVDEVEDIDIPAK